MDGQVFWGILGVILLGGLIRSMNLLRSEMGRVNTTLENIAKHMGVPDTNPATANIDEELKLLIAEGKNIKAVKRYRMVTGLGLLESKQYVDSLSSKMSGEK
ncbi:hypothetical protein [Neobacillus jeddahensis]|uniref:hypothetical protein n=1 Tax=Neobacillus jeddahensis TaxID=1461580 RepID=UPI00058BBED0|nr:hypothetical protein [Neobacillus jeddahensis]